MGVLSRVAPAGAAALAEQVFLTPRRFARPRPEVELLASARRISLGRPHAELAAWEWGSGHPDQNAGPARSKRADPNENAGPGPRVLLVHGWEGRGAQLGALVAPLTRDGYRVATFDAPAHGDSPGRQSSLVHVAEVIQLAARTLGPLHTIVAHSMGGAAALWASRDAPLAERLVLIAPPIDILDFTRALSRTLGFPEEVRRRVHGRLGARFGVPVEAFRADVMAARMRGPLLVVHDEQDREVPVTCGEAIARAWPEAELVRTQGLGHQRILRDPAVVATIVRFVARSGSTPVSLAGGV
jgi:pimeloyl-ACP methyl ester carboxylesterase